MKLPLALIGGLIRPGCSRRNEVRHSIVPKIYCSAHQEEQWRGSGTSSLLERPWPDGLVRPQHDHRVNCVVAVEVQNRQGCKCGSRHDSTESRTVFLNCKRSYSKRPTREARWGIATRRCCVGGRLRQDQARRSRRNKCSQSVTLIDLRGHGRLRGVQSHREKAGSTAPATGHSSPLSGRCGPLCVFDFSI